MTSAQKGEGVKKCSKFADKQYRVDVPKETERN